MNLSLGRKIQIAFLFALILLITLGFLSYRNAISLTNAIGWEQHTQEVILKLDETLKLTLDSETAMRGYLITEKDFFLEPYFQAEKRIPDNVAELEKLLTFDQGQRDDFALLKKQIVEKLEFKKLLKDTKDKEGLKAAQILLETGRGKEKMDAIRNSIQKLKATEQKILKQREDQLNKSFSNTLILLFLGVSIGIVSLGFANIAIGRELKKRFSAEDDLKEANQNLEKRVEERTSELKSKNEELEEQIKKRERAETFREIALEAGNLGTWMYDPNTDEAEIDDRGLSLFGFSGNDFDGFGKSIFQRIYKEDFSNAEKLFQNTLDKKIGFNTEFRVVMPDDSIIWNHCTGQPQFNEDGEISYIIGNCRDITERKEREMALQRSDAFANAILNSLSAHIAVVDKNGKIVAVNEAWQRFAQDNSTDEQLFTTGIGQNYLAVCTDSSEKEDEANLVGKNLREILDGKKDDFIYEYPCHSPNEMRWFLLQITSMKSKDGGAVISHINITDRKNAEIELKESEEFNRSIFENSPDCVKVLELDGTLHSMNTNGLCLMEIDDLSEFVGKQWIDFWQDDENEMAYQAVQSAQNGKSASFEGFCKTAKGTGKWWSVSVAPILGADGKPSRLISTSRDITERRKFEEQLHRQKEQLEFVLEIAKLGFWSLNLEDNSATRSLRHDQIFGYDKLLSEWTYETFLQHVLPSYRESVNEKFQKAVNERSQWDFETQILRADGKTRWVWARGKTHEENGNFKMHGTVMDITERKNAEQERENLLTNEKAARQDAEVANRLRDEFLATVSHELRAPLNSILGWGRLLEKGTLDEQTTEKAVNTIVRNAESQNRLINDLLDVSRIIAGKLRLEIRTIKPLMIVEAALESVKPAADAKGIKLEIKEDGIISHISGDSNRLQQVVWNLLSNAIKFTPNGGKVCLEMERDENFIELRVIDNGIGIKEEFLPHVFDRFRQADASSIRKFGGLGLGLAIVRHITEMHGGTVAVFSQGEDQGSTFTVRLPLLNTSEKTEAEIETSTEPTVSENDLNISLAGLLILVVDDENDTLQLLRQFLTSNGATVITANSVPNALNEIQTKSPDVLVSDIGMPEEDGYSLIKKVRNLDDEKIKHIPAVALTAFTRSQDRIKALSTGFQSHVSKPVEPDELVMVIASLVGRLQT